MMINRNLTHLSHSLSVHLSMVCAIFAILLGASAAQAANHSDAPLIKLDPQVNLTDTYAFVGTKSDNPAVRVLNVVVQVRPFSEPGDGAIFERFSPDARYSVNITNPATGELLRRYDFEFSPVTSGYKRTNTVLSYGQAIAPLGAGGQILNVGDENQNYTQTYTVTRVDSDPGNQTTVLAQNLCVPPQNVGSRVTPLYNDAQGRARSGAATFDALDRYTQQTIYNLPSGETVWSGPREDGFYSDIPGIFNLLDPRLLASSALGNPQGETPLGTPSAGTDGFRGYNVLVYAIQIPISDLPSLAFNAVNNATFFGPPVQRGVGVFASTARPQVRILNDNAGKEETLTPTPTPTPTPTAEKRRRGYSKTTPEKRRPGYSTPTTTTTTTTTPVTAAASNPFIQVQRLGNPIFNEGMVAIQDKDNLNATAPTVDSRYATYALNPEIARLVNRIYGTVFQETDRTDLQSIFIPEVLRVNTETEPVRLAGQPGFNRLSTFGGDRTANGAPSGWPNGRRLGDDVSDILLTSIASGPSYALLIPVGDSVPANDQLFQLVFPYAGTPNSGARNSKDSGENFGQ